MSIFRFKHFQLLQEAGVMKFGTDSMLLGAMAEVGSARRILDIGCGTGIMALMCAQRSAAEILAIDKDAKAVTLARKNIAASPWGDRITVQQADFIEFFDEQAFDLIISNPPFFRDNGQYEKEERLNMRSNQGLSFAELARGVEDNLTDEGACWIILPFEESFEFEREAKKHDLFLAKEILVRSFPADTIIRRVICFRKVQTELRSLEFTIYSEMNRYSKEYIDLTKDFHEGDGAYFA